MSFKDLKRNSKAQFEKLNKELEKINSQNNFNNTDDRIWTCKTDKAGNGSAVIRFLPAPEGEDVPFVRLWSHGFKGPGGWYIENSLSTINKDDPVNEMNTELWNQGEGSLGRKRVSGSGKDDPGTKRQLNYYSNIYVVKDPANPENEGKVFLFRYGKKIYDKINDAMYPQFDDQEKINPFDLWEGANFRLRIRRFEGYPNYDQSAFDSPGPLLDDDDELEKIYNSEHSLAALIAPDKFKTYEQLKARLDKVLGKTETTRRQIPAEPEPEFKKADPVESKVVEEKASESKPWADDNDDDDEDLAFFSSLADDD